MAARHRPVPRNLAGKILANVVQGGVNPESLGRLVT